MEKANLLVTDVRWPHNIIPLCFIVLSGRRGDYTAASHNNNTSALPRVEAGAECGQPGTGRRGAAGGEVVSRHGDQAGDQGPLPLFAKYGEAGGRAEDGAASAARV